MTAPPAEPRTLADSIRLQAEDAMQRGHTAADPVRARAWFERARRLLPTDPTIATALAGILLRLGDPEAVTLFTEAATQADTREIWLGVAAAQVRAGNLPQARAALAHLLSHHILPADVSTIDRLATLAGAPAWCGVARTADGTALRWIAHPPQATATLAEARLSTATLPATNGTLRVTHAGAELLGSPIDLAYLSRIEGFVTTDAGSLTGWAWLPSDADTDPWLTLTAGRQTLRVQATDTDIQAPRPMTRPRRFTIGAPDLGRLQGPITILGPDGNLLAGSPVDPAAPARAAAEAARLASLECPAIGPIRPPTRPTDLSAPADLKGPPATAPLAPHRPVAIVIPVHGSPAETLACLHSVFATCPADTTIIVIDDASPEPALVKALDDLAQSGRITLLRNRTNLGFPASANAGLRSAFALTPPHDALLLNSDTLLPTARGPSWLDRLRATVHAGPDIGTAAPLSNDATILSYPNRDTANPPPDKRRLTQADALAARANPGITVDIPTSVGFCMYLRRECAEATGLFRPSLFARGYGEENDFCIRARHLGWRHVAVPGVFVAHLGGTSFGAQRAALIARNTAVMERLHPGYQTLIAAYHHDIPSQDALAHARRRMDALRWASARRPSSVLLISHDSGGGVERVVQTRIADIEASGQRAILLRPVSDPASAGGFMPRLVRLIDGTADDFPNLVFDLPKDMATLSRLLRADRPSCVEIHHRMGLPDDVMDIPARLGLPIDHRLHDYASFCPRVTLLGPERRYCGEPVEIAACEACVADAGDRTQTGTGSGLGVAALRARSTAEFAAARSVAVPSADMARRLQRHFPTLRADIAVQEDDAAIPPPPAIPATTPRCICVLGAIGVEKGFDILLACARDAAARRLPLEFVVVGHTTDDTRLIDTGRVFVTGRYPEAQAEQLVRAQSAHLAFLPSIIPETWSFTLGLAWRAGLRTAVFDLGAMATRVRATGFGFVLPLGLPAAGINNALLAPPPASLAAAPQDRLWTLARS